MPRSEQPRAAQPRNAQPGSAHPGAPGRPRALIVVNNPAFLLSHFAPLVHAAREAGYDVHVASPSDGHSEARIVAEGGGWHEVRLDRRSLNPATEARTLVDLVRLYRRLRPTVVHHITIKAVLYGTAAARAVGVPRVVNSVTGLGYLFLARDARARVLRRLVRTAYRRLFAGPRLRVVFENPDDRAMFTGLGLVEFDRTLLVPGTGVALDRFTRRPPPSGSPVVLLAARLLWDKGVGEFVDAARMLRAAGSDARFVLVGDVDANRASVGRDVLARWADEGVVEWWGHRTDMPDVLAAATVVCLPSYREGCPKVLLEAAASGRPIVASDVPGCREPVRSHRNGVLVPVRDAAALAAAIRALLADPAALAAMGRESRALAEREFDEHAVARQILTAYA